MTIPKKKIFIIVLKVLKKMFLRFLKFCFLCGKKTLTKNFDLKRLLQRCFSIVEIDANVFS